jgi:hypothetical protein
MKSAIWHGNCVTNSRSLGLQSMMLSQVTVLVHAAVPLACLHIPTQSVIVEIRSSLRQIRTRALQNKRTTASKVTATGPLIVNLIRQLLTSNLLREQILKAKRQSPKPTQKVIILFRPRLTSCHIRLPVVQDEFMKQDKARNALESDRFCKQQFSVKSEVHLSVAAAVSLTLREIVNDCFWSGRGRQRRNRRRRWWRCCSR